LSNRQYVVPVSNTPGGGGGGNSTPPTTTFPATVTSLAAFGDSITLGFGIPAATDTTASLQSYAPLFADMLGLPLTSNSSVSGASCASTSPGSGYANQAYALAPAASVGSVGLLGANDITFVIGAAANQTVYTNALSCILAWLAIPAASKASGASITYVGAGWSSFTEFGLAGKFTAASGNTASATVSGTSVYIAGWTSGDYGSFAVTVDGISQGSFTLAPAGNTMSSVVYPYLCRVSGLSAGSHTVVITNNAATDIAVQWFGGNSVSSAPLVVVGNTIPRTGFTSGNISTMNTIMASVVSTLVSDGLNVVPVLDSGVLSATATPAQYQADLIHPNMLGHTLLSKAFYETFCPATVYPTTKGTGGDNMAQILNTPSLTPSLVGSFLEALGAFWAAKDETSSWASLDVNGFLTCKSLNKITAYNAITTAGNGIPSEVNQIAATGLTANYNAGSAKTIFTPTAASQLRISFSQAITTADAVSSTFPSLTLGWTDVGGIARTKTLVATSSTNTTAVESDGVAVITTNTSTGVTLTSASYASNTPATMTYALSVTCEVL